MDLADRLREAVSGQYEVERELGRGGMAVVYLARDLRHERRVAIKVLRPELSVSLVADRFLREIQIAARLQHPLIVPLHDSGGTGELLWYVMPFVEGETLRQRLQREGQLSLDDALAITADAAAALQCAHEHGFVHRDIKPENILLSGGHALLADFGIARALTRAAGEGTSSGVAIGTPAYMSPEQAAGGAVIDARSDVYALACVLYEMLAGEPPFTGATPQAVIAKHVSERPPSIAVVRPNVPATVRAALERALAKTAVDRQSNAAAFAAALRARPEAVVPPVRRVMSGRWTAGAAAAAAVLAGLGWGLSRFRSPTVVPDPAVIAVLPFDVAGPGVEGLGEGMVSLLSANLDDVGPLHAISPRSIFAAWRRLGGAADFQRGLQVGAELGAGSVLLGSAVAVGEEVRLAAELRRVSGERVTQAQVVGLTDSLLALVDRLSMDLLRSVLQSSQVPAPRLRALSTQSVNALRLYLLGEHFLGRSEWDSAAVYFQRAVTDDSAFALAHLRLAEARGWSTPFASEQEVLPLEAAYRFRDRLPSEDRLLLQARILDIGGGVGALEAARAYVARHPHDAEGWFLLADVSVHTMRVNPVRPDSVLQAFDRALALEPTMTRALIHPLHVSAIVGDHGGYDRYLARLAALGVETDRFAAWREALWGSGVQAVSTLETVLAMSPVNLNAPFVHALARSPARSQDEILAAFARVGPRLAASPGERLTVDRQLVGVLTAWGRVAETATPLSRIFAADPFLGARLTVEGSIALGVPSPALPRAERALESRAAHDPMARLWLAWLALWRGRTAEGARWLDGGSGASTPDSAGALGGLLRATRGWLRLVTGDTVPALVDLEAGLAAVAYGVGGHPLWYQWEDAMARRPALRGRALERLRYVQADLEFLSRRLLLLGDVADRLGERGVSRQAYQQVVRLLGGADPLVKDRLLRPALAALQERGTVARP